MVRALVGLSLLALFTFPVVAQNKKPKADVDVDKDTAKAVTDSKKKLMTTGKIAGKVVQVEGTTKNFTVQVTAKIQVPNPDAIRSMANFQRQLAEASLDRNPANRARRMAEIQYNMSRQQMYSIKEHHHKVELQAADEAKVRTFRLPVEYDDKGKPRQYTQKELKELKGPDPKLPGYTAEWENLRVGQEVEVTIVRPKPTPAPKARTKDKDRDFIAEDERIKATLIVIYADPPAK
jgi:hypothetical protein